MNHLLKKWTPYFSLFSSLSTLICCALPALFVTLGLGATLSGLLTHFPFFISISEHKKEILITAGLLLGISIFLQWSQRNAPCPLDPKKADACTKARNASRWITLFSVLVFLIGLFFSEIRS